MTIYHFNLLVGYVSTGVDYAQAYRAQILRDLCDQKFVFLDVPQYRELRYYSQIGIAEEEMLVLPFLFVNAGRFFPSLPFEEVKKQILSDDTEYVLVEKDPLKRHYSAEQGKNIIFYLTEGGFVYQTEYYIHNTLIRKDHYSDRLLFSEYMRLGKNAESAYVKVCQIDYYDQKGAVGLREYRTKDGKTYCFPDRSRCTMSQLLDRFLCMNTFSDSDVFVLDRTHPHLQALLKYRGNAKLVFFMHSKLTFADYSDSHHWKGVNYEYTDLVRNADRFHAILTSTNEQAEEVRKWFMNEYGRSVKTFSIPAGGMKGFMYPEVRRKRHALLTVSRLDHRKRIDLLIRAAAEARKSIPDLTLDIFGEGPRKEEYRSLITEKSAQTYICLKGYVPNFDRYIEYDGYISASLWETFGLTLLEAMSAGLPLIGLNVPYGNRCFIHNGQNGILIPFRDGQADEVTVSDLASAIVQLYETDDPECMSSCSYREASKYTVQEIRKKWICLFREIGVEEIDHITG